MKTLRFSNLLIVLFSTLMICLSASTVKAIDVLDSATSIPDGTGNVPFGSVTEGGTPITKTFTIKNTLGTPLTILSATPTLPSSGFSLVGSFPSSIPASSSDTFQIQLETGSVGTFSGELSFNHFDFASGKNPYNFTISGTVNSATAPEIAVSDPDSNNIPNGGSYSFGITDVGTSLSRTFTVDNTGDANLTLTEPISAPTGFNVETSFGNTTVTPSGSTTFTIELDASSAGMPSGSLSFTNNDSDEGAFDFTISGTVNEPEIDVLDDSNTSIADGFVYGFGATTVGNSVSKTFTVKNTGLADLTLGTLSVPTGFSVESSFGSTTVTAGNSTTFTIKLDAATAGISSGSLSFGNNDTNENPYDFTISGTVAAVPEIDVSGSDSNNIPDGTGSYDFGTTAVGTTVSETFTVNNTGSGVLNLMTISLPTGFTEVSSFATNSVSSGGSTIFTIRLDADTSGTPSGELSFNNDDGDENPFNFTISGTVVDTAFSIDNVSASESDGSMTFTVTRNNTSLANSVKYATSNDTALSGSDFSPTSGTLSFTAGGASSATVTVNLLDDDVDEDNETFFVDLSNPVNATITDNQGVGTIQDNDTAALSITDITVTEGNSGTGTAIFFVTLDPPSSKTVTVNYQTADGTASAGTDYEAAASTALTFDPGVTSKTIDVVINGDVTDENDETFHINLSAASNATIADAQGVGTITTDDSPPVLSIDDVSVTEGNSDSLNATFTVSLSPASSKTVTVIYGTEDGTASAGADYAGIEAKTLTFSPGDTSKAINIIVSGDDVDEDDETFFVNLSDAGNATIGDAQGIGTITSDDSPPSLSINDITVTEGFDGTTNAAFTVTLSTPSSRTVSVTCKSLNYTAIGESDPASTKSDFISAEETLTFNPGVTEQTFEVAIKGDDVDEDNETFFVNLSDAANATISDLQGEGMIIDDDGTPTIWISDMIGDTAISEGDAGTVNASFEVSLSNPNSKTVTVICQTADGTTTAGSDYQPLESVILTFEPDETMRTLNVFIRGDIVDEADETFFVRLSNATNGEIADDEGIGTIADDDAPPTLSIADAVADEGDTSVSFVISLSVESEKEILVDYATNSGTAVAQKNFTPIFGTLTIPAGEPNGMLTVELVEDNTRVGSRGAMFTLDLNNPVNATLRDNRGVGIISGDVIPGDMDENGKIDLADAVLAVQILAGMLEGNDLEISELIFILQTLVDMS